MELFEKKGLVLDNKCDELSKVLRVRRARLKRVSNAIMPEPEAGNGRKMINQAKCEPRLIRSAIRVRQLLPCRKKKTLD